MRGHAGDVGPECLRPDDIKLLLVAFDSQLKVFHPLKNDNASVTTSRYVVPTGRGKVPTDRVKVPTGRVKVPAGRYVVPTGKDDVIVSAGRS
ncbi:hypothetical protein Tco_1240801, partial [Tanacetum coccineum]